MRSASWHTRWAKSENWAYVYLRSDACVKHAVKLLKDEVDRGMALLGITSLAQMKRKLLMECK